MPELPDIELYLHALRPRVVGRRLERLDVVSPSVLRTFEPAAGDFEGRLVEAVGRSGKRFVFSFEGELYALVHLMIAGRWQWSDVKRSVNRKAHFAMTFDAGMLTLVESGTTRRAGLHLVRGREALRAFDAGGIDTLSCSLAQFAARLRSANHTLKRALTDPQLFDGIGNAYSDEILHAARLSPIRMTSRLEDEEIGRLYEACRKVLVGWREKLLEESGSRFPRPGDITAFRPDFAVHGRFLLPCPVCKTQVQRIRYAENETDYCPRCQTQGIVLADRSLSRLLKNDWPRKVEDWERGMADDK